MVFKRVENVHKGAGLRLMELWVQLLFEVKEVGQHAEIESCPRLPSGAECPPPKVGVDQIWPEEYGGGT